MLVFPYFMKGGLGGFPNNTLGLKCNAEIPLPPFTKGEKNDFITNIYLSILKLDIVLLEKLFALSRAMA